MPRETSGIVKKKMAAVRLCIAAIAVLCGGAQAVAQERDAAWRLAVELRVTLGDLARLERADLPSAHAAGLEARIRGALGLLPWRLQQSGDQEGADSIEPWQGAALDAQARDALVERLTDLAQRFPLDLMERAAITPPGAALAEARAIDQSYCFGCHEDMGAGDPYEPLPARDLFLLAQEEPADVFLARLSLGIKGDETIGFRLPVTDDQLLALFAYFRGAGGG